MNLQDLSKAISKFAPILGSVIPLPGASAISSIVAQVFGEPEKNIDKIIEKINSLPDAEIRLKQIQSSYEIEISKIVSNERISEVNAEQLDRSNARNLQVETKSSVPSTLTYIITVGFFVIVLALFLEPIPEQNESLVYTLVGCYTTVFLSCIAYWFGTSFTSQKKDNMLYNSKPL